MAEQHKSDAFPLFSLFEINITGMCNRFCEFCPRSDKNVFPNKSEYMSLKLYEKVIKELNELAYDGIIAFSGFSEPLFHKDIYEIISLARKSCAKSRIELYTNGDLLNVKKLAELFNSGCTSIHISLYDGPEQIEKFLSMRDMAGIKDEQFIIRERFLPKKDGYGLTISNRAGLVNFQKLGMKRLNMPFKSKCYYPFYMMFVDYTGEVIICSHDWGKKLIAGNLREESIVEVWTSKTMRSVRDRLDKEDRNFSPCNECDVKGTFMGGEHFKKWQEYYKNMDSKSS
ncbi:MAG: SPASM domain-containing protein [Ignavibacteriae bacterium]|nr:SPASM domain-containing protein [Ignavibacteriota bacterium]